MNRTTLFAYLRRAPFGGRLLQGQIDGINVILAKPWGDDRHLAYALATAFHETAATMQAVLETRQPKETVNPSVDVAIRRLESAWKAGAMPWVKTPYWRKDAQGRSWLGRGLVQLTHHKNYLRAGSAIGIDLVADPAKALDLQTAADIMFVGMKQGIFTGKKLSDYFNDSVDDPEGARRIINGTEKAKLVAGYYRNFLDAIRAAREDAVAADVTADMATADDIPAAQSKSLWTILGGIGVAGGASATKQVMDGGASLVGSVTGMWQLIGLLSLLGAGVAVTVLLWLILSGRITITKGNAIG